MRIKRNRSHDVLLLVASLPDAPLARSRYKGRVSNATGYKLGRIRLFHRFLADRTRENWIIRWISRLETGLQGAMPCLKGVKKPGKPWCYWLPGAYKYSTV